MPCFQVCTTMAMPGAIGAGCGATICVLGMV